MEFLLLAGQMDQAFDIAQVCVAAQVSLQTIGLHARHVRGNDQGFVVLQTQQT